MSELLLIVPSGIAHENFLGAGAHGHPDDAGAVGRRLSIHLGKLRSNDFVFITEAAAGISHVGTPDSRRIGTGVLRIDEACTVSAETADGGVSGLTLAGAAAD